MNKINSFFGEVEVSEQETNESLSLIGIKLPKFVASLIKNNKVSQTGEGETENEAITNLYKNIATQEALKDTGAIE